MKCSICNSTDHRVIETVDANSAIRRRRKCDNCGHRWTTFETTETPVDLEAALANVRSLEAILRRG